jgi:hypothetical protein
MTDTRPRRHCDLRRAIAPGTDARKRALQNTEADSVRQCDFLDFDSNPEYTLGFRWGGNTAEAGA